MWITLTLTLYRCVVNENWSDVCLLIGSITLPPISPLQKSLCCSSLANLNEPISLNIQSWLDRVFINGWTSRVAFFCSLRLFADRSTQLQYHLLCHIWVSQNNQIKTRHSSNVYMYGDVPGSSICWVIRPLIPNSRNNVHGRNRYFDWNMFCSYYNLKSWNLAISFAFRGGFSVRSAWDSEISKGHPV